MMSVYKFIFSCLICTNSFAQTSSINLSKNWQFTNANNIHWCKATVPGTVHTDLLANKLIPDPFFADNEKSLQWIDTCDWLYKTNFIVSETQLSSYDAELVFEGLDTYADISVNGMIVLKTNNMFRGFNIDVKPYIKKGKNELKIYFHSAKKITDSIANASLPLVLPDNNRVYARKAAFQFGWDWGPVFIGCGIWKKVQLDFFNARRTIERRKFLPLMATLIQQQDSIGASFYFEQNGKPVYAKGANWIPANIFLPSVKKEIIYRCCYGRKMPI